MPLDIVGPANAPNSTTSRPSDTRSFGASDTWTKDCTSSAANDGTKIQAGFVNGLIAQLRGLIRGNGLTGASADIVTQDNTDDSMALKSVQHLIQRGQSRYAVDSGSANAVVVSLSPAAAEYKAGLQVIAKVAANNTGASTINVNGLGTKSIKHWDGSDLGQFDLSAGALASFVYDGTNFQLVWSQRQPGAPIFLQAPRTYFVNASTGSDSNNGLTSGTAFATLQKAINTIALFNLNGFNVTVTVADGTYSGGASLLPVAGSGNVNFVGNTGSPVSCLISTTNRSAIIAVYCGAAYTFNGFMVGASGSSAGDAICGVNALGAGTQVTLQNMRFGACVGAHVSAQQSAGVFLAGGLNISGGCTGNGLEPGAHMYAAIGGVINASGVSQPTLTISAPVSFAGSFAYATQLGAIAVTYFSSIVNPSNVTGRRYVTELNSVINTFGGGPNFYPGTIAGLAQTGGAYV